MLTKDITITRIEEFAKLATGQRIDETAKALEANGIQTLIAETAEDAKRLFFELVPEGAEVFLGSSVTLEQLGIKEAIDASGRYDALRPKMFAMNRQTQGREIRKLVDGGHARATEIIKNNVDQLHRLAGALLELETLTGDEIKTIVEGGDIDRSADVPAALPTAGSSIPRSKRPKPGIGGPAAAGA